MALRYVFCWLVTLLAPVEAWGAHSREALFLRIQGQEPTLNEIIRVALHHEGLDAPPIKELKKKMKWAPWLPTLYFGVDHTIREAHSLSISDNISVTGTSVNIGPSDNDWDRSVNEGDVFRVRAVWKLDETVYHPDSLRILNESREAHKSRLALMDYLFKIYAERRQMQAKLFLETPSRKDRALLHERITLLTDRINALTQGLFAQRWWEGGYR